MQHNWLFPTYNFTEKRLINFRIPDIFTGSFKTAFEEFLTYYVPDVIAPYATKYPKLIARKFRVCRFCKKTSSTVTFRKEAHVIPEFLGNRYLIHDIECDECNSRFSKYEDSFANSLGLLRTADGMKGKQGVPKFKDKGLIAFDKTNEKGESAIYIQSLSSDNLKYNEQSKTITFQTTKVPYVPLHVIKVLFKIGYSVLSDKELPEYFHLEKIINTDELDQKLQDYCKVSIFTFSHFIGNPFLITFKKKAEYQNTNIPTKVVLLYFGRYMYEYILLNSTDDFMIKKGGIGKVIYAPPYWDQKNGSVIQKIVDFSSTETFVEKEELFFIFETEPIKSIL